MFPILNPPPSSLPIPSLWVVPVHQPQASSIMRQTWTGNSFHTWYFTCFNAILPNHPTLSLSHRVHKTVLYISVSFTVSYTGLLSYPARSHPWIPGAAMGVPTHGKGHAERIWHAKVNQNSRGPWTCPSIYPKTKIYLFYYFTTFTNSSDINRGVSPITFLCKKINLEL